MTAITDSGSAGAPGAVTAADKLLTTVRRHRCVVATVVIASAASLALRAFVPPVPVSGAEYDDRLAVDQAGALAHGDWLGRYRSYVTMAKGVGYPLFVATCHLLSLPVLIGQQVLHLLAVAVLSRVVFSLTRSVPLALVLFCVLAIDPSFYGTEASRFVRDNWYASVCLLLFGLVARQLRDRPDGQKVLSTGWPLARHLALCLATGSAFAAYWLGREERPWLLPALFLLGLARVPALVRERRAPLQLSPANQRHRWFWRTAAGTVAVSTAAMLIGAVALENHHRYGVYLTNDTTEGQFSQAFGQWQRVKAGPITQYVPITSAMRQAVYAVSPAARELAPQMEGPVGQAFYRFGCAEHNICGDVTGGWTQWALRAALFTTERDQSARRAQQVWGTIAIQIRHACRNGSLQCRPAMPLLLPQLSAVQPTALAHSFSTATRWLVGFHIGDQTGPQRSLGRPQDWVLFAHVLPDLPLNPAALARRERNYANNGQQFVQTITAAFRILMFPFALLALLGYLISPLRRRPHWGAAYLVGSAAGLAVLCRLSLIALVDSTSFPAARTVYLLPASPLLIACVAIGGWLLVQSIRTDAAQPERKILPVSSSDPSNGAPPEVAR